MGSERRPNLWAGVGLALCYAGPVGSKEFMAAKALASDCAATKATGVALACAARIKDQSLFSETREALWGIAPEELAARVESIRRAILSASPAGGNAYASWRENIAGEFVRNQAC